MTRRLTTTPTESKALTVALTRFRADECDADLAAIVDDFEAIRLLAAWSGLLPVWKRPKRDKPRNVDDLWSWLWEGVHFDRETLAARARLDEARAHQLLKACVGAFAVYPDGTLSEPAHRLVEAFTKQRWPGRVRGRPKGSADRGERTKGETE